MKAIRILVPILAAAVLLTACSTTRSLHDGEFRLAKNRIQVDDRSFNTRELQPYLRQKPNSTILFGWNPFLEIYNLSGQDDTSLMARFFRKIGQAPVVYDPTLVDSSIENMLSHLEYIGYYGSDIRSEVKVHKREVNVTYHVRLGKRYPISELIFDLPDSEEFRTDFEADKDRITIRPGQYLATSKLEEETERSARYFRTKGYYGFSKTQYFFEADTLAVPGKAALTMSIRDYTRNDVEKGTAPIRKYRLGDIRYSYDRNLHIRPAALEGLNLLRPGDPYDESVVNRTYARLSALHVFNGVNISLDQRDSALVDCNVDLRHSRLQGFKLNLEGSTNSAGLIGISPQLSYFHKNIFHGGERLNIGLKGNFQFKPRQNVRSTEFTISSGLSFPEFVGLPNRLFKGASIPRTEVTTAFNYQNRPEYTRTAISASFGYSGSIDQRFFFQFFPIQASVVRVFDIDIDFLISTLTNPYAVRAYQSHFDAGLGAVLYYTTDNSISPKGSYHYYRLGFDLSGNVLSLFKRWMPEDELGFRLIWGTPFTQYVRGELQVGRTFSLFRERSTLAFRLLSGAGYAYGNSYSLPFEKAFYAGGASSMRGWQARTLGPGGSPPTDFFVIPNQYGAIKLEADAELRFPLFWKFDGAVFGEIGNVWDFKNDILNQEEATLSCFPQNLAADWGFGLRLDFDIILVRLDLGMRVYDPARAAGDRWVAPSTWLKGNNFAIHFGVGYPF